MSALKKKSETCGEQLRRMCRKEYLGAEIMVAGGGPTIWVNTYTKQVEGYWGGDRVNVPFSDNLDLDDYCEEMYGY